MKIEKTTAGRPAGIPKTGGRQRGTPNRVTASTKEWITNLIDSNRQQIEADLQDLEPKDRITIIEKLLNYVIPKRQAISVEAQIEAEYKAFEALMAKADDEVIDKITQKMLDLEDARNEEI